MSKTTLTETQLALVAKFARALVVTVAPGSVAFADALLPDVEGELASAVERIVASCNDLIGEHQNALDDAQRASADDTNAHGFFDTHTTDAAW